MGLFDFGYGLFGHHDGPAPSKKIRSDLDPSRCEIVEVAFHDPCDVRAELRKLLRSTPRMVNYIPPGGCPIPGYDKVRDRIVSRNPWAWSGSPAGQEMPSGYFSGATGHTREWVESWQIGERSAPWKFWEPLQSRAAGRSHLVISCLTWFYGKVGDYETSLVIEVESVGDIAKGGGINQASFDGHRRAARDLATQISKILRAIPPSTMAQDIRELFCQRQSKE